MKVKFSKRAASAFARLGGSSTSPAKAAAARRNGLLGGRPRKIHINENYYTLASLRARLKKLGKL